MAHNNSHKKTEAFGKLLGYSIGNVAAYSSDYKTASDIEYPKRSSYRSYYDGVYMGHKWQCVEFARRYLYINMGYIFDDVAMAYDIFELRTVRNIANNELLPFNAFVNGNKTHPVIGGLLIWQDGGEFEHTGHVAVITDVTDNYVRIAEQNVGDKKWDEGCNYARELKAKVASDGSYWITCSYGDAQILGWMIQRESNEHSEPSPTIDKELLRVKTAHANSEYNGKKAWLNIANNDEAAFVEAMGGHQLTQTVADHTRYFALSNTAQEKLEHASNELHELFMHATDYVLEHPELLKKFNFPQAILPKIRQSWDNRLNQLITSRFDFALTEHGLKVYEYNCDSASCYMEAGKVQGKWAEHYHVTEGVDAGDALFDNLARAWKKSHAKELVHILRDDDIEEKYHALFMQEAIEAAGLQAKVIVGMQGLSWDNAGNIIDADGQRVKWVWKTWSWETALDQIREECEADELSQTVYQPQWQTNKTLRLSDVLFNQHIMVFEPMWSLIPSNKAILPVLWTLFPNHPLLLNASFELTNELKATGYVTKPIVGRCGANIALFDKNNNLLEATEGEFANQDKIYQQFYPLPNIDGHYTQVCTFSAAGVYAGSSVRVDKTRVVNKDSDCLALRFFSDKQFLSDF